MPYEQSKLVSRDNIRHCEMQFITPSDSILFTINGLYPRGFTVMAGGTLSVWTTADGNTEKKVDLGTVPDGFTWTYGGFLGVCETTTEDVEITASNILAIP